MRMTTRDRVTKPASPLVSVEDGKPTASKWQHALHIVGAVIGAAVGAAVYAVCAPGPYDYQPGAWRFIGAYTGGALAIASGGYGLVWFAIDLWAMISYQFFLHAYRMVELDNRRETQGLEVEESITEWELDTDNARDLLVAIIAMQWQVNNNRRAPWAHRVLTEDGLWFDRRKLADVGDWQARRLPDVLSQMGYISDRSGDERKAGNWTIQPLPRAYNLVSDIADHEGVDPTEVHRWIAMGKAIDKARRNIGKVL